MWPSRVLLIPEVYRIHSTISTLQAARTVEEDVMSMAMFDPSRLAGNVGARSSRWPWGKTRPRIPARVLGACGWLLVCALLIGISDARSASAHDAVGVGAHECEADENDEPCTDRATSVEMVARVGRVFIEWIDTDGDGADDALELAAGTDPTSDTSFPDADADRVSDPIDNCPSTANPDQANFDGDGFGDACDAFPFGPSQAAGSPEVADSLGAVHDGVAKGVVIDEGTAGSDSGGDRASEWNHFIQEMVGARVLLTDSDGDGIDDLDEVAAGTDPNLADTDADGFDDDVDNCALIWNDPQIDTDGDGCGNPCDGDYDQSGSVGAGDFAVFRAAFQAGTDGTPGYDPNVDADGNGSIGAADFGAFRGQFIRGTPGPSFPCAAGAGPTDISDAILTEVSTDCADYADAYVASATDLTRALDFDAQIDVSEDTTFCTLSSNAIPNHDFNDATANFVNDVAEVERSFSIVRAPQVAATPTVLAQQTWDAVLLNGVVVDLLSAGCWRQGVGNVLIGCNAQDDWRLDPPGFGNIFGEDLHNAHTQPDGTYHYHANPNALFDDAPGVQGSPVIGFAADGFLVRGSYFVDSLGVTRKALSGWSLRAGMRPPPPAGPGGAYDGTYIDDYEFTGAGDLDECNGMWVDGEYAYYVTDAYPWILNCHTGTPDPSFMK